MRSFGTDRQHYCPRELGFLNFFEPATPSTRCHINPVNLSVNTKFVSPFLGRFDRFTGGRRLIGAREHRCRDNDSVRRRHALSPPPGQSFRLDEPRSPTVQRSILEFNELAVIKGPGTELAAPLDNTIPIGSVRSMAPVSPRSSLTTDPPALPGHSSNTVEFFRLRRETVSSKRPASRRRRARRKCCDFPSQRLLARGSRKVCHLQILLCSVFFFLRAG